MIHFGLKIFQVQGSFVKIRQGVLPVKLSGTGQYGYNLIAAPTLR